MCVWIAAATSYCTHGVPMIPFYIFYSMFGFQRVGDLAWAAGDMRARGFLLGGTAGRTTLNGEGPAARGRPQPHPLPSTIPNCISYDPTFAYEVAVIIQDGLRRMYEEQEDVYYYITVMNENYAHPAMPEGAEKGILKGMYLFSRRQGEERPAQSAAARLRHDPARGDRRRRAAGEGFRRRRRHLELPELQPSCARDGLEAAALEHAASRSASRGVSYVEQCLKDRAGPGDRRDRLHEGVRRPDPRRSCRRATSSCSAPTASAAPTRARQLRRFFEVDRHYVAVAALKALADEEALPRGKVTRSDQEVRHRSGEAGSDDRLGRVTYGDDVASTHAHAVSHERNDRSQGPRHRRLQGRPGHRGVREARRRGEGRGFAHHARVRQGDDGRAVARRGRGEGAAGSRSATRCPKARSCWCSKPRGGSARRSRAGSAEAAAAAAPARSPRAAPASRAAPAKPRRRRRLRRSRAGAPRARRSAPAGDRRSRHSARRTRARRCAASRASSASISRR